jgi:hypothetical protein
VLRPDRPRAYTSCAEIPPCAWERKLFRSNPVYLLAGFTLSLVALSEVLQGQNWPPTMQSHVGLSVWEVGSVQTSVVVPGKSGAGYAAWAMVRGGGKANCLSQLARSLRRWEMLHFRILRKTSCQAHLRPIGHSKAWGDLRRFRHSPRHRTWEVTPCSSRSCPSWLAQCQPSDPRGGPPIPGCPLRQCPLSGKLDTKPLPSQFFALPFLFSIQEGCVRADPYTKKER